MNKARSRKFWTLAETKYRQRSGNEFIKAVNVFTGYYKNNEQ